MLIFTLLSACDSTPAPAPGSSAPAFVAPSVPGQTGSAPAAVAPPAAPATPRAAADEAFNDAMRAFEGGAPDAPAAVARALEAYGQLKTLDSDATIHVAFLQLAAGDMAATRKTCDALLVQHPDHLFALATGARAAVKAQDDAGARAYYERFVAAWDKPRASLPEYSDHDRLLPIYQQEALAYLATHSGK